MNRLPKRRIRRNIFRSICLDFDKFEKKDNISKFLPIKGFSQISTEISWKFGNETIWK